MNPPFKEVKHSRWLSFNAKIIVIITLLLAFVLVISTVLDIIGAKKELGHVLSEQAKSLIAALEAGGRNAVESYNLVQVLSAERLLNVARLLEEMDYRGVLTEELLQDIAKENNISQISLFDASGQRVFSSFSSAGRGRKNAPPDLMAAIQKKENDELIMGFRQSRFSKSQRFVVAKRRRKGGVMMLNIEASEMLNFRRSIGLGTLVQDIAKTDGVSYIVIQDSSRIIIATANVDSMTTPASDAFLAQVLKTGETLTRFTTFQGQEIFEVVRPFDHETGEFIRLGLITKHIRETERSAMMRAILSSIILLVFGGIVSSWFVSGQNYKTLKSAYERIETYTGSILKNMSDAVVAVNSNGEITLVNEAAEALFNIHGASIRGKQCSVELSPICPYLNRGRETGENQRYDEETLQTSRGVRIAAINVNVVAKEDGQLDAVFAVIKDITEQKRLEENVRRGEQISAMGRLASGVAHEIRNPLNAIGIIAQRLKAEFEPKSDAEEYNQLAATIVSETRRINDIIQQFLQFSRPAKLNKQMTDIVDLLAQTSLMIRPEAEEKGVLITEHYDKLPSIQADADKLKQVFLNLARNALEACSHGDKIEFSVHRQGDAVVIKISDTGHGIPKAELDRIFNLYYTTKDSGSGIGLSIVQQIISQHNGVIEVQSSEQKGTTFTITLLTN